MNIHTILYDFVGWLGVVLTGAIIIRVLLSWFSMGNAYGPVFRLLDDVTDPILRPLRRVIPPLGMIDISPIIAILLINFIVAIVQGQIIR